MRIQTGILSLTSRQRSELERIVRHQSGRARSTQRARMIILAAEGVSKCEIGRRVGSHYNNVAKWIRRWREHRGKRAELLFTRTGTDIIPLLFTDWLGPSSIFRTDRNFKRVEPQRRATLSILVVRCFERATKLKSKTS